MVSVPMPEGERPARLPDSEMVSSMTVSSVVPLVPLTVSVPEE